MSNLRFFTPVSKIENYTFINVMTSNNTIVKVCLNNSKIIKQNSLQVCFDKNYIENEINTQIYAKNLTPLYALGIKNLSF